MPPRNQVKSLPPRNRVKLADTWDLSSLFSGDAAWEKNFAQWEKQARRYEPFRGTLHRGVAELVACLKFDEKVDRQGERLGTYAFLKTTEDMACSDAQRMMGRYQHVASEAAQAASFIRPEILAIPARKLARMLQAKELRPFRLMLQRLIRYKPHTLGKAEERLLAMQTEMAGTASRAFRQLTDADMSFGTIRNERKETVELSHATFSALLHSPQRSVRRKAFNQYYRQFQLHENTLSATLAGSVQRDVFEAKSRGYGSALEAALFPDRMPPAVYDNLLAAVHDRLPVVYRYLELRRRKMRIKEIHHYDTYVPILSEQESRRTWKQATRTILRSLEPLGKPYGQVLERGLTGRWCDRYPNRGKQSGAFSCGTFDGDPYILMNYQPDVLDHMFTLTHEAGHSMHSFYSAQRQPYRYYDYAIFVAEVASTFNEQLLSRHLMAEAKTDAERAYLVNRDIDAIRGTIIRQTMFAEFEKIIHAMVEAGEPLTVDCLKREYGKLLAAYFGPDFVIDESLKLECLRIPHFYRAFYVYKYATGMSAAIALSERVLHGGPRELEDYLAFLQGGCSQDPLDLLRGAGVDMASPEPVRTALDRFAALVDQLDALL